jgi:hypothetical protein
MERAVGWITGAVGLSSFGAMLSSVFLFDLYGYWLPFVTFGMIIPSTHSDPKLHCWIRNLCPIP